MMSDLVDEPPERKKGVRSVGGTHVSYSSAQMRKVLIVIELILF